MSQISFLKGRNTPTIELLAIPFNGPLRGGRDTDGEFFSPRTDLCLDWFPVNRPLLYHHGMDGSVKTSVVGRVDSTTARKAVDGWWVEAQLKQSSAYFDSIKDLIERDKLFGSSGAMPHLTQKARNGEILRWPWVEQSLTPTPANLFSVVQMSEAKSHYKAAGLEFTYPSEAEPEVKAGRVLSASNEQSIRDAVGQLQRVLDLLGKAMP